jgi:hypothetical protein
MQLTPQQRDLLIRTIIGEAAAEPFVGQQAVANVVLNRLNSGRFGDSLEDVLFAPAQFEPWNTRKEELLAIPQTASTYRTADMAVEAALQDDPTGGALNFYAPDVMEGRGGEPAWAANMRANGTARTIGNHIFGQADGPGTAREDRGTAWNSGYGEGAPAGLLDAEASPDLPVEPDWDALKDMGGNMLKKAMAEDEEEYRLPPPLQHQVLQPLRRVTLKGLLG